MKTRIRWLHLKDYCNANKHTRENFIRVEIANPHENGAGINFELVRQCFRDFVMLHNLSTVALFL